MHKGTSEMLKKKKNQFFFFLLPFSSQSSGGPSVVMLLLIHLGWIITMWCVIGVGMALIDGCANPELAAIGDAKFKRDYGKLFAVSSTATGIGFIVTPPLSTFTAELHGFQKTWIGFGGVLVFGAITAALGFLFSIRRNKKFIPLSEEPDNQMAETDVQLTTTT
jgi:MFS family permease